MMAKLARKVGHHRHAVCGSLVVGMPPARQAALFETDVTDDRGEFGVRSIRLTCSGSRFYVAAFDGTKRLERFPVAPTVSSDTLVEKLKSVLTLPIHVADEIRARLLDGSGPPTDPPMDPADSSTSEPRADAIATNLPPPPCPSPPPPPPPAASADANRNRTDEDAVPSGWLKASAAGELCPLTARALAPQRASTPFRMLSGWSTDVPPWRECGV